MAIIKRSTTTIVGLDTIVADLNTAISTEATARANADGVLANLATTAKTNLVGAINEVKSALDTEVTARTAGQFTAIPWGFGTGSGWNYNGTTNVWELVPDSANGTVSNLTDVFRNLTYAIKDSKIYSKMAYEHLGARIDNALSNVDPAALDSLTEIVTAFQAADSTLNGAITTLATNSSNAITAEATARADADTEIKNALAAYALSNTEITHRIGEFLTTTHPGSLWGFILDNDTLRINTLTPLLRNASVLAASYTGSTFQGQVNEFPYLPKPTSAHAIYLVLPAEHESLDPGSTAINHVKEDNTFIRINNFSCVRTTIEGQTYDLEVSLMYKIASANTIVLVIELSSEAERVLFAGKTFKVQYTVTKEISANSNNYAKQTIQGVLEYADVTPGDFMTKKIAPDSTPWGYLVDAQLTPSGYLVPNWQFI